MTPSGVTAAEDIGFEELPGRIISLPEDAFVRDTPQDGQAEQEFVRRTRSHGKLDAGRTVRSGLAYDLDSTVAIPARDAERAAAIKAELGDEPLHGIQDRHAYRFVKRAFDIVFSAAVIVAFSWHYLLIAIAVKIGDPKGPVFFKQERVGWSIIGQKSGAASGCALRPALSALKVSSACHPRERLGVVA